MRAFRFLQMVGKKGLSGRTSLGPDGGRKPPKKLRINPTYEERKLILTFYVRNGKIMKLVKERFFKDLNEKAWDNMRKNIYKWMKPRNYQKIMNAKGKILQQQKIRMLGTATTLPKDAELEVVVWIKELRNDGAPVPGIIVQHKAKEIAAERNIPDTLFSASATWLSLFLRRHKLSLRAGTRIGQNRPSDAEEVKLRFAKEVNEKMAILGVTEVWAADQTAMFYEYVSKNTIDAKGSKTIWIRAAGREKERVTLMLLGSSSGEKKLPWLIFKSPDSKVDSTRRQNIQLRHGFGKDVWAEVEQLQRNNSGLITSQIYRNKAGWWNSNLMQDWLQFNFGFRSLMKENPILLIVDDFGGHWTEAVQIHAEKLNVHLMRVPPGYTCVAAPPDVAWNFPLKRFLRREWLTNLYSQFNAPREANQAFKLSPPKRPLLVSWALQAWESLSSRTIAAGFKKVGIETSFVFGPSRKSAPVDEEKNEEDAKLEAELEKLSNSVFDEMAKLEIIDKEFTISSEDSDAIAEEERISEIVNLDDDGEEKKEHINFDGDGDDGEVEEEDYDEEEDDYDEADDDYDDDEEVEDENDDDDEQVEDKDDGNGKEEAERLLDDESFMHNNMDPFEDWDKFDLC